VCVCGGEAGLVPCLLCVHELMCLSIRCATICWLQQRVDTLVGLCGSAFTALPTAAAPFAIRWGCCKARQQHMIYITCLPLPPPLLFAFCPAAGCLLHGSTSWCVSSLLHVFKHRTRQQHAMLLAFFTHCF
jgi:hypothetical protein